MKKMDSMKQIANLIAGVAGKFVGKVISEVAA